MSIIAWSQVKQGDWVEVVPHGFEQIAVVTHEAGVSYLTTETGTTLTKTSSNVCTVLDKGEKKPTQRGKLRAVE